MLILSVIASAASQALLQAVLALGPLERAVDDLLRVLDDHLDQVLRRQDALLDQHGAQALARPDRAARVGELAQA